MSSRAEFPRICVALGCGDAGHLEKLAREACAGGEQFLEVRLDLLDVPERGVEVIRRIHEWCPEALLIATCRRQANGGRFQGGVEQQLALLESAMAAGAGAVDIEIESAEEAPARVARLRERAKLIVSYHNFESTPALGPSLRRLRGTPADVHKLATTARRPTDNWRLLELVREASRPPVAVMAMGETGLPSRVLALAGHAAFTYASPPVRAGGNCAAPTAPGQVPAWVLRRQYHAGRLTSDTQVYGVIADPVGHSISPAVHNRAFQARRVDAVYLPFLVGPPQLGDFLTLATRLPVAGFSVTIPHKQRVIPRLDAVDPPARRVGAVNTVYRKHGRLRGTNTDVAGVTAPLEKRLRLKNAKILIVGNGGAARAAAFALADKGARISLTGRNPARVRALARLCGAAALAGDNLAGRRFDALVHATPVGMFPKVDDSWFPDEIPAELVFDMVYNPLETRLLARARAAGKQVICGLEMFLEQAAAQFEIWTGASAPRLAMQQAAREALGAANERR